MLSTWLIALLADKADWFWRKNNVDDLKHRMHDCHFISQAQRHDKSTITAL